MLLEATLGEKKDTVCGWKIGLTTRRMQQFCGVDTPIVGAILSSLFQTSPAVIPHARYVRLGIEMEVAVQLGSELHDRPTAANVKACLSQVAAAFELVEDRGADYAQLDACSIISDNSWNAGIVIGEPVAAAALGDLLGRAGVLRRDGEEIGRGLTNDAGGDPLEVVAWLASLLQAQGRPLRAGHWVLTGSIIPTIFPGPGEHYEFSVDGLPAVELQIE
ncbi:MAG: hypothetical protein JWN69_327 [Alphaproteobacteria bacterium]|nr:hypothetical protein [Alphaproteobacteria bacterium]